MPRTPTAFADAELLAITRALQALDVAHADNRTFLRRAFDAIDRITGRTFVASVYRRLLVAAGALAPERIMGVETGGCPHTAIREDASMNLAAVADMRARFPALDLILIESGGDNLAATFSPELADITIYVIDVAAGDKIPSKGGPGITRSDLLVINKIDLAPHVGASLEKMDTDARRMRGERPFVMTNLKKSDGLDRIISFIETKGGLRSQGAGKLGKAR